MNLSEQEIHMPAGQKNKHIWSSVSIMGSAQQIHISHYHTVKYIY